MTIPKNPEMPQGDDVQKYFQKIYADYQSSVEKSPVADVHRRIKAIIEPRLAGVVLDIGSGGDTRHRNPAIRTLISVDNVVEFLQHAKDPAALNAAGDIRALPFRAQTADRIVTQFVVHHLAEKRLAGTTRNIRAAVAEAARVLKPGGMVFVVDSMAPRPLDRLQRLVYPLSRAVLRIFGKPMVFILSPAYLAGLFAAHGLAPEKPVVVDWGGMTDLSQALFPRLKFPLRRTPVKLTILAAVKPV
jgi:ubiquinone/menaquinone biosynthesis C-methylase UbiE